MLYGYSRDPELTFDQVLDRFRKNIGYAYELYLYNLHYLVKVAQYALQDAERRSSKHLPTEEDKAFTGKLFLNEYIQSLVSNEELNRLLEKNKFTERTDPDMTRRLYTEFAKGEVYKTFLANTTDTPRTILKFYCICTKTVVTTSLTTKRWKICTLPGLMTNPWWSGRSRKP